jgi:hypothetical protein
MSESRDPMRWERLSVVAAELGISIRMLQLWCKGGESYRPALPHRWVGHRIQVQPAVAYEHLQQHAPKMAVQTPAGLNKNTLSITTTANGSTTAADVLERLASDPEFVRQHGTEVARAMISARSELRRAAGDLAKASTLLTPEEFSKGLRAAMSLFVSHVEDVGAKRCATRIMGFIRKHFDVDLVDRNPAALGLLERELREDYNCSLRDFCQAIEDRSRGVRLLSDFAPVQPLKTEDCAE